MTTLNIILVFVGSTLIGCAMGFILYKKRTAQQTKKIEEETKETFETARKKAQDIESEAKIKAKETVLKAQEDIERELRQKRRELQETERRFLQRESNLDKKVNIIDSKEAHINQKEKTLHTQEQYLNDQKQRYEGLLTSVNKKLEKIAGMTALEAKKELKEQIERDARKEAAAQVNKIEEEMREASERKARKIISFAIQRYAGEFVSESTVSTVSLPSDEMKGRIIGREGRNIRCFETVTGVDVIIDDTPETVILSSFDPVRREVAKITLERLVEDGRIHPSRIEELCEKVDLEVKNSIKAAGEQATFDVGVHGIHPEVMKVLGSLKYRSSAGQNVYRHSIEVAFLAGMMATELGVDEKLARRAGLLHDMGKGLEHTLDGSHAAVGAQFAKKHGENEEVVHAIAAHNGEVKAETILAHLVASANQLSLSRPGAKREMLQSYIQRLVDLEKLACSFEGVMKAYAIQAGREIRVLINHAELSDEEAAMLSRDICRKVESDLTYPGQIKVSVVRETRAMEIAR